MNWKKGMALGVAVTTLVLSLAGCGGTEDSSAENVKSDGAAPVIDESGFDEKGLSAPGELPITKDPITISVFVKESADMEDITKHTVFQELTEKTNINFDFTVVPEDGSKDKLNMLLAGGDYPDVIFGAGLSNSELMRYGASEGIFIPLNDLIDKYGKNIKDRWEENPQIKEAMTAPDGNIYGIPTVDSGGMSHNSISYKMWMNTEWLDKVGMDMPETTEDFRKVLEAFRDQDVNGNGDPNDEIPLSGATQTWAADVYLYLLNAFDYFNPDEGYLKLKDGVISGCADTEGFKEGLDYIAGLYRDGLIDPAALTQNQSQLFTVGNGEEVVLGTVASGFYGIFVDTGNVERAQQYDDLLPLTGPNGYRGIPALHSPSISGAQIVITDKCKNPEAALKLVDLFCGEEWTVRAQIGIKGHDWDDADEGTVGLDGVTPAKYKRLKPDDDRKDVTLIWALRGIEPNWKNLFQVTGSIYDTENLEARLQQCTDKLRPYVADVDDLPAFYMDEDTSMQISSMQAAIDDYVTAAIVDFITGAKSVDKDWDAYIDGLKKLQYDEYIELNQQVYDENYK